MPRDIVIADNTFVGPFEEGVLAESAEHKQPAKYRLGKAENVTIDGKVVPETRVEGRPAPRAVIRLQEMREDGVLRWK